MHSSGLFLTQVNFQKKKQLLEDPENRILISAVSFWEISLKVSINELDLGGLIPEYLPELISKIGFEIILISAQIRQRTIY